MPLIPGNLINFRAYGGAGATELLGMTDVELPTFESMRETIAGAGIAGEIDNPVPGHFQSMAVKLKWRQVTREGLLLLAPIQHAIVLLGSAQVQDAQTGVLATQQVRIAVNGPVKMYSPGKFEPGKATGAEAEIEVQVIRISLAGVLIVEHDKLNSVHRVGGFDYLRSARVDQGGV